MWSLRVLVHVLVLTLLGVLVECGGGTGDSGNFNHDKSGSDLNKLYNSKVVTAEKVVRPLGNLKRTYGPISHSGVKVTLDNGEKYLVHKGPGFGRSSQTVVVDAKHMSDRWRTEKTKNFNGERKVSDFVKTGGKRYNVAAANCHQAANRMMRQKTSSSSSRFSGPRRSRGSSRSRRFRG